MLSTDIKTAMDKAYAEMFGDAIQEAELAIKNHDEWLRRKRQQIDLARNTVRKEA